MTFATRISKNPLLKRDDFQSALTDMLSAVSPYFNEGDSGIHLGNTTAHYGPVIAKMEGLSRMLWGIFPSVAGGSQIADWNKYIDAIRHGTDPEHPEYWGLVNPFDQRCVEMAVYGLGLMLLNEKLLKEFSPKEQQNIHSWLSQITSSPVPDNNWNYFGIMVQIGFKKAGLPWDQDYVLAQFERMEKYYIGNGWYSDGPGRPKDYYISMAFHYYGLIYATQMADEDPQRAQELRARATVFARDFIHLFSADGSAIPFGRSLTYRFAEAAFWSAVAYSDLDVLPAGEVKGLVLRHMRWWLAQPIFDRDGILSIGYCYPNLIMAEDYNSPGSPYWAFKLFLILALPEEHAFWQVEEQPLRALPRHHSIKEADQILVHDSESEHVYMLTSGQLELNNYVNTEQKYTKFAYSNLFGFTVERGRFALNHAACDNMLMFAEQDEYYRGRRECSQVMTTDDYIYSRWSPWKNVQVDTWLIPCEDWHVRVHHVDTERELTSVEGGFSVISNRQTVSEISGSQTEINASNGYSTIVDLPNGISRTAEKVITPPNSNIIFAECAAIPVLKTELPAGKHWLISAVAAHCDRQKIRAAVPVVTINEHSISVTFNGKQKEIEIQ